MTASRSGIGLAILSLLLSAQTLEAVDLAQMDRTIAREPMYASDAPRYCLMVFGPEARERVWLVLDAGFLFVDCNGNGDLTEPGERVGVKTTAAIPARFEPVELSLGGNQHRFELRFNDAFGFDAGTVESALHVWWLEGKRFYAAGDDRGPLTFADTPQEAPIVHIGGPLEMGLVSDTPIRPAGDQLVVHMAVGTKGLGPGTFAQLMYKAIPWKACPQVVLEIPGESPGQPAILAESRIGRRH